MAVTNWLRQTPDKPLYGDLLWSRPENKRQAGKLLIAGGNSHAFSAVSAAYAAAEQAGIGSARIILPDSLQKALFSLFPEAEFAPSSPSGSFARTALAPLLDASDWAEAVLLAGDFGRNSETAILLETFADKYKGKLTLVGDSLDYFIKSPAHITRRDNRLLVADMSQLQKLTHGEVLLQHSMDLLKLVEALGQWSSKIDAGIVTVHNGHSVVALKGQVSTTLAKSSLLQLAAYSSVWSLQHPSMPFEAITTAVYCANED